MAEWGAMARAVEEGLLDAESGGDTSGGSLRGLAEALTGSNFAGFKMRDIFDKDRWSRRERVNQGRRLEETGIPDYTYDYNPRDQAVLSAYDYGPPVVGKPIEGPPTPSLPWDKPTWDKSRENPLDNIRQWGTQNPNQPGSMALDPTWAGGVRGAGLGAEMTPGEDRDLSKLSREPGWSGQGNPGQPLGVTGYLPGRLSVGEARRERELRNRYQRDREMRKGQFLRNIHDSSGPTPPRTHPDWQAIEEDMAMRAMRNQLEREYEGRDN